MSPPDPIVSPRRHFGTEALRVILLVIAIGGLVAAAGPQLPGLARKPASAAVDLLPLWCRARSLVQIEGACDPSVMAAIFHHPVRDPPGREESPFYYPPTAGLLFVPTAGFGFAAVAAGFRWLSVAALVVGAAGISLARPTRDRWMGLTAAIGLAAAYFALRVTRGSLIAGQTGPLLVGLTGLAFGLAGRRRDVASGVVAAIGIALKLFPILLVPALFRRRSWLGTLVVVLAALTAIVLVFPDHDHPTRWLTGALEFVDRPMRAAWIHNEPPWVLTLWQVRFLALGVPSLLVAGWSTLRPRGADVDIALAAVLIAFGGTVMAGSPQTHEGMVLLPAVGWILVWPAHRGPFAVSLVAALLLVAAMVGFGVGSRFTPPNSLHWIPIGYLCWILCVLRWAIERRAAAPTAR